MRRCKMAYAYARPKWTRWAPGKPANLSNYLNLAGRYEFPHAWRKFANAKKMLKLRRTTLVMHMQPCSEVACAI